MMAWLHPRVRTLLYWGLGAVMLLCMLANVGRREEFCTLCGKKRSAWTLRLPRLAMAVQEHASGFSKALEPLVHGAGGVHRWHVRRGRSLLGGAWDAIEGWRTTAHPGARWSLASRAVQATCRWDPLLGVTAGQYILAYWAATPGVDGQTAEDLGTWLGIVFESYDPTDPPIHREPWNRLRRMVALPELSPEEMDALIARAKVLPEGARH